MASLGRIARSLARVVAGVVMLPVRFLAWVYQPDARRRPGRGELQTHRHAAQLGADTGRWIDVEQTQRQREADEFRAAHDAEATQKDR